jgi:alpha-methylacyl-CoA racemase
MTRALEGLKILDFTTLLPGPYATMIIAGMGIDIEGFRKKGLFT